MTLGRPLFIVFEGLDGSGKSTCAAQLAERIDAELVTTPSPRVRRYREDLVESLGSSQEARQLFHLATVFAASEQVASLLKAGRSVVLDRYFLSTQAYAAFRGSRLELDHLQSQLLPADFTVYMDTPFTTRVTRLHRRGMTSADLETITADADLRLREEHLKRAHLPVFGHLVQVSGDAGTPTDLIDLILAQVSGRLESCRPLLERS